MRRLPFHHAGRRPFAGGGRQRADRRAALGRRCPGETLAGAQTAGAAGGQRSGRYALGAVADWRDADLRGGLAGQGGAEHHRLDQLLGDEAAAVVGRTIGLN